MEQVSVNPLQKYFRVPGITVRLPSKGKFQSEGNITFTATEEVPILPMRAADEILVKNPDALMSGYAITELIRSCCPAIKDPNQLPTPDVDVILLAIRSATFGNKMEIETECPECGKEHAFDFDIPTILETITDLDDEYSVRLSDEVVVYIRPFNLTTSTKAGMAIFQESRKIQIASHEDVPDEARQEQMNASYKVLTETNLKMMASCVEKVVTPDGIVTETPFIQEFIGNIPREWSEKLNETFKKLNESGVDRIQTIKCSGCEHEWDTSIEFDPSSFFGQSS